jgi:two-component system sensor histidine kinase DesK
MSERTGTGRAETCLPTGVPAGEFTGRPLTSWLRRWRLIAAIFLIYLGYALPELWSHHGWPLRVVGGLLLAAFVGVYLGLLPVAAFGSRPEWGRPVIGAMVAIAVVYLLVIGGGGIVMATYLAIALVLVLPTRYSVPLVLAVSVAVVVLPQYVAAWDVVGLQFGVGVPTLLVAMAMYGMRNNVRSTTALYQARREVEHLAAEQERLRIARDLHDLLGHALTTVTVKAELAARLAPLDPDRAAREMTEVAELARQGLADVRATVSGYREVSLISELASAREVLTAAGMTAVFPAAVEDVPLAARELFGWAVREGITNAVRHSRADRVEVRLTPTSIEIIDDGRAAAGAVPPAGNGLTGLGERVEAVGGRLTSGPRPDGGFALRVELPGDAAPPAAREPGTETTSADTAVPSHA